MEHDKKIANCKCETCRAKRRVRNAKAYKERKEKYMKMFEERVAQEVEARIKKMETEGKITACPVSD